MIEPGFRGTMRVLMYYSNSDVRLEELPRPKAGPGELLIKVMASGICGSDVMEWYRRDKVPLVLGHEVAGEVVEVGDGVDRFSKGDRVAATHHVPCNTCHYCLSGHHTVCDTLLRGTHFDPGGFAEYVRVPAINVDRGVFPVPGGPYKSIPPPTVFRYFFAFSGYFSGRTLLNIISLLASSSPAMSSKLMLGLSKDT